MLIGNLGRDPELRVTPKGTQIATFSLALNHTWKTDTGEKREEVTWVDCEAWGKIAETIAKYMFKGRSMYAEGRLKLDQWEDKNTKEKRSRMKVVVEQFQFLGENKGGDGKPAEKKEGKPTAEPTTTAGAARSENLDEDVPF